jgi:hypothetical protein
MLLDPSNEKASESCLRIKQRFSIITQDVSFSKCTLLPPEDFYGVYINPYTLLGYDQNINVEDISEKDIQKRKKLLLQEIDLEEGRVQTLSGHIIDRSRAISLCEELLENSKKTFHSVLFRDERLNNFLQQGDMSLFLLDEEYCPIATLEALDSPAFLEWISPTYAQQYNLVFSNTMETGDLQKVAILLGGRRYVTFSDEDDCFSGASRILDRRVDVIRAAAKEAAIQRPSLEYLKEVFTGNKTAPPLNGLLNILPLQFRSFQDEAFTLFRGIYLVCNNKFEDTDLTHSILLLAKTNKSMRADLKTLLEEDEKSLDKIIQQEKALKARQANKPSINSQIANPRTGIAGFISRYPKTFVVTLLIIIGAIWGISASNENESTLTESSQQQTDQAAAPPSTEEDIPPVGTGLMLTENQIRYCLSQNLRLDGAQSVLNKYSQSDVDHFNAMIDDYNSRCGNFEYQPGELQSIQAQVNLNSATLQAQGEALFSK